jgi:hypothetical protein
MLTPKLPRGYHAQPAFHHQDAEVAYDFYRVYDASRELDLRRSYWLMTEAPDTRGPLPPRSHWVAFYDWAHHGHRDVMAYGEFANPQTPMATVRQWIADAHAKDLVEIPEA